MSEEQIYNAVRIIKKYGLRLRVQFIVGAPYDTIETMNESYKMARRINADYTLFPAKSINKPTTAREVAIRFMFPNSCSISAWGTSLMNSFSIKNFNVNPTIPVTNVAETMSFIDSMKTCLDEKKLSCQDFQK